MLCRHTCYLSCLDTVTRPSVCSVVADFSWSQGERADTAAQAEQAAQIARQAEAQAVEARRAQDCAYSERKSLEAKAYRIAPINSALSARGGYLMD